jgi:SNF2 family DNA or RNA helicase
VLIWARFRPEIDMISKALEAQYPGQVGEFHGGIKEADRTALRRAFQDPSNKLRLLVLQVDTGGVGLTLSMADKAYYYSNGFSLESRLQSEARNHRSGSEIHEHVTYSDILAQGTLDTKLLRVLRHKLSLANVVTGDNWREWV